MHYFALNIITQHIHPCLHLHKINQYFKSNSIEDQLRSSLNCTCESCSNIFPDLNLSIYVESASLQFVQF